MPALLEQSHTIAEAPTTSVPTPLAPEAAVRTKGWHAFTMTYRGALASAGALAIYTFTALLYFWWPIHTSPATLAIGSAGPDVGQNYWYLRWWPYALSHGLNPFITYKIWNPIGYNLAWQTSLPGPSLLLSPLISLTGVVEGYNILLVVSFVLTAWATYILCYHFVRQMWASLIGGYLFGFSGFMVAQASGHIHLIGLYVIPISLYLYALRREGRLSRPVYVGLAALPLLLLFLTSVELFTFVAMFGYLALALYWFLAPKERHQTFRLALETTGAFVLCGGILSPYLYYMAIGYSKGIVHPLDVYSGDVLGFVIPTNLFFFFSNHVGRLPLAGGNGTEQDSYLGLPLVLVMGAFAIRYWRTPVGKLLSIMTLVGVAFTLGPQITVANVQIIKSPMYYVFKLPILEKSIPIRYALFVALVGALMAAVWLAREVKRLPSKVVLGLVMVVMLIPNLGTGAFLSAPPLPAFFTTSLYHSYIRPNDVVLILPMGFMGNDMSWQQAADFSFSLSAGYGGSAPHADDILPVDYLFYTADVSPYLVKSGTKVIGNTYVYDIEHYIATRHVSDIVVAENEYAQWSQYLSFLHETPIHVGGVWYYRIPPELSHAILPGQSVAGDAIPRPYVLHAAVWNDRAEALTMPSQATGEAVETLADLFPSGNYDLAITVNRVGSAQGTNGHDVPSFAEAEIIVNGEVTDVPLHNGVTHTVVHVTTNNSTVQTSILGTAGTEFDIGDTVLSRIG